MSRIMSCVLMTGLALAATARATTYNAVNSFSATTNTKTSLWSYRYNLTSVRDNQYALLPTEVSSSGWSINGHPVAVPFWVVSDTLTVAVGVNKYIRPLTTNFGA